MLTESARKIADDAKSKGLWLYDPESRMWYSPEEFKHIFHYVNATDELIQRLKILDPHQGIEAGFKRLAEVQLKLQGLINMVMRYYKK